MLDVSKQWRNKSSTVQLKGFDEFIEALQKAGKSIDVEGRKCFEKAGENVYDALYSQAQKAGLKQHLIDEIDETVIEEHGLWKYEVGWKKQKPSTKNPLPDTYKVMFYNYGTPNGDRITKKGYNRGKETAHPKGSHGFIKKAKNAAANKNKKLYKETLQKILGDLQR